jgi:hypothetical protein
LWSYFTLSQERLLRTQNGDNIFNDSKRILSLPKMRVKNETFTVQQTTQPSAQQEDDKISFRLTAPFLLNQAFAKQAENGARVVNSLD